MAGAERSSAAKKQEPLQASRSILRTDESLRRVAQTLSFNVCDPRLAQTLQFGACLKTRSVEGGVLSESA